MSRATIGRMIAARFLFGSSGKCVDRNNAKLLVGFRLSNVNI